MGIAIWLIDLKLLWYQKKSEYAFHSYVAIHYSLPKRVKQLTGITYETIKSLGLPSLGDGVIVVSSQIRHFQISLNQSKQSRYF